MRYYCKYCGCIIDVSQVTEKAEEQKNFEFECPVCGGDEASNVSIQYMEPIPDYETPAQYKKRTGKEYFSFGLVWYREKDYLLGSGLWTGWRVKQFIDILGVVTGEEEMVIADPPVPPPEGWKPDAVCCFNCRLGTRCMLVCKNVRNSGSPCNVLKCGKCKKYKSKEEV